MKQFIKSSAVVLITLAFCACNSSNHNLIGKWKTYNTDGSYSYVAFKNDGTFSNFSMDGKEVYHQGNYKFKDDVFSVNDNEGCGNNYWATYKFNFVNADSFYITVVQDSCSARRNSILQGNAGVARAD